MDYHSLVTATARGRPALPASRHRLKTRRQLQVEPVALDWQSLPRPIDWVSVFGNLNPVEIEIGVGKGTFLTEQARLQPQVNFLGVEWSPSFWRYACDRLRRHGCLNVRMVAAEAFFFLQDCVASGSVRAVHLFFPDPWPKKRHHKRRLVQTNFLQEVARVLVDGGRLSIVTDHRDYFAQIEGVVAASPLRRANFEPPPGAAEGELAGTNFERKYRRQGRELLVLAALKEPAP